MRRLLMCAACLALAGCLLGCSTHGYRKWTLNMFGQTISFEDDTKLDETGTPNYMVTFTDDGCGLLEKLTEPTPTVEMPN